MRRTAAARSLLLALCLGLLGLCLLLAGAHLSRDGGVTRTRTETPGGGGTLYLPGTVETAALLPDEEEGQEHSHGAGPATAGRMPAVLILHSPGDGAEALAVELARRGTAALTADGDADPALCWEWFSAQDFARGQALGLAAGPRRGREALELTAALAGGGAEPAAVMLLGDASLLDEAAGTPGRNMLFLLRGDAPPELRLAYCGSKSAAEHGFSGYFGMGTAKGLKKAGLWETLAGKNVLAAVIDWQGSALGHRIELPDDDLVTPFVTGCRFGAAAVFVLALAAAAEGRLRKKRGD